MISCVPWKPFINDFKPWLRAQSPKHRMTRVQRQGNITPPKTNNANTVTSISLHLRWAGISTSSSSGRSQMGYTMWRRFGDFAAVSLDERPKAEQASSKIQRGLSSLRLMLPLLSTGILRQKIFAKISMRHRWRDTESESMGPTGSPRA